MKDLIKIILIFFLVLPVFANPFDNSFKTYNINSDDLYFLSFSAINQNNYKIKEIQSKKGYIIFMAQENDYLLNVSKNAEGSSIRITQIDSKPQNDFSIQQNMFKTLDELLNYQLKKEP